VDILFGALGALASILAISAVISRWAAHAVVRAVSPELAKVHRRIDDHMKTEEKELRAANEVSQALARQVARICGHLNLPLD
jgi:hypothetical protein